MASLKESSIPPIVVHKLELNKNEKKTKNLQIEQNKMCIYFVLLAIAMSVFHEI